MMVSKIPKYQQIKDNLRNKILSGHYKKGDRFFTEAELIQTFQVSSITIIRALKELEKEGYITRKQGVGTFISRTRKEKIVAFASLDTQSFQSEVVNVLSLTRGNDPYYLKKLGLHQTQWYYTICRTRRLNDQPYLYQISYIPHDYILNPDADLNVYQSLYRRFYKDFEIQLMDEQFQSTTDLTTHVPNQAKNFLGLSDDNPCVRQIKVTQARNNGRVLEYCELYKSLAFFTFSTSSVGY
ncbi:GntR family transcriptional regulator [Streptococcus iniae]|uniref:GntR family transcriptional regulator n=1 Tax=Streptococcus iniae TaxID=1346 RepID=UPI0008DB13AD|nr:GntR family transcriptional regulator [Streptococcus iniae]OHX27193.1 GntR family transcriptional regulator [Streptococcus iniae]RLV28703.1 GntR family transcriptional regulator [Streptococcus iniae]